MSELEIKCPRPLRALKRKPSDLEIDVDGSTSKRPTLFWSVTHSVDSWIEQILRPEVRRSRSDGFLLHEMTFRTPAPRAVSAQEHHRTDDRRPPTPYYLNDSQCMLPPAPLITNPKPAPTLANSTLLSTDTVTSRSSDITTFRPSTQGVASPTYRDTLNRLQVHIHSLGRNLPEEVRTWSSGILERQRTSPGLTEEQVENTQDVLAQLECESEIATRETFAILPLFPPKFSHPHINQGHDELWNTKAVPYKPGQGLPPISTPKADRYYGYRSSVFDDHEYAAVNHRALRPYALPGSTSYWPFFMVEFKSQSRGGTLWAAVNQNAGTGAHTLNSIKILREYSKTLDTNVQLDNYVFTCVADATNAALWVHWLDGSHCNMAEVAHFHFARAIELRAFRDSVKNIIDHAIDVRLPRIKELLTEVALNDLERIEKAKRVRRSSEVENFGHQQPLMDG